MENSNLPKLPTAEELKEKLTKEAFVTKNTTQIPDSEVVKQIQSIRILPDSDIPDEQFTFEVDNKGFFAIGDIHGLKAKAKQGKTTILKVLVSALILGLFFRVKACIKSPKILYFDTEQKLADVHRIICDIKEMTNIGLDYLREHVFLYPLRSRSYETLIHDLELMIREVNSNIAFLDGIVDFIANFNDVETSRQLIYDLQNMAQKYNCAIVCVLHENKSADDENMRGHLGTMLEQKSGTILQARKSKTGLISVSCPSSRHGDMPTWNIRYDSNGKIIDADAEYDAQKKQEAERKAEQKARKKTEETQTMINVITPIIRDCGNDILKSELNDKLQIIWSLSRSAVSRRLNSLINDGMLIEKVKRISLPEKL